MKKYYVTDITKTEEYVELKTDDKAEAIQAARDIWDALSYYDKIYHDIEVRSYLADVEDEDCSCWDYDLTPWQIWIGARETGEKFERCRTIDEAERKMEEWEEIDMEEGTYTKGFYSIMNENAEHIEV